MQHPETVMIQTEPSKDNPTGVVIINKDDFVEGEHKLYEENSGQKEPQGQQQTQQTQQGQIPQQQQGMAPWAKQ